MNAFLFYFIFLNNLNLIEHFKNEIFMSVKIKQKTKLNV